MVKFLGQNRIVVSSEDYERCRVLKYVGKNWGSPIKEDRISLGVTRFVELRQLRSGNNGMRIT